MTDRDAGIREVDRYLYRLTTDAWQSEPKSDAYKLRLVIHDTGSWLMKFQANGRVVLNNCDLVMTTDFVKADALISFVTLGNFWGTVNGHINFDAGVSRIQGGEDALSFFKKKFFSSSVQASIIDLSTKSQARAQIEPDLITTLPIKSGWLIKRRDLMHGWKQRYFKIYIGRFEYFADPQDPVPRGIIPLLEAKISTPVEFRNRVKNRGVFHQIVVDPKYHEKTFKLISLQKGDEGHTEMLDWVRAFEVASKPAQNASPLFASVDHAPSSRGLTDSENNEIVSALRAAQSSQIYRAEETQISKRVRRVSESIKNLSGSILDDPQHNSILIVGSIGVALLIRFGLPFFGIELDNFGLLINACVMLILVCAGWELITRMRKRDHNEE
jgi:hypothetical protein